MPDMKQLASELADSIVSVVKGGAKDFLSENKDAEAFLVERAKRVGELAIAYVMAADDATRQSVKTDLDIVRQSMENEVSTVAVKASAASRELFKSILSTATGVLVKALPTIVAAL